MKPAHPSACRSIRKETSKIKRQPKRESNGSRKTLSDGFENKKLEDTIMTNKNFKTLAGLVVLGLVCSFVMTLPMEAQARHHDRFAISVGSPFVYGYSPYIYSGPVYTTRVISGPVYDPFYGSYVSVPYVYGPAYRVRYIH
jgi:hypothetical protein